MTDISKQLQQTGFNIRALNPLADAIYTSVLELLWQSPFTTELAILNGQAHLVSHDQHGLGMHVDLSDMDGVQALASAVRSMTVAEKPVRDNMTSRQAFQAADLARAVTVVALTRQDKSPSFSLMVEPDCVELSYLSGPEERPGQPTFFWQLTNPVQSLDQTIVADWHINHLRAMATDEMRLLSDYWQLLRTTGASTETIQEVEKTLNK